MTIRGNALGEVKSNKYLGFFVQKNGSFGEDIKQD